MDDLYKEIREVEDEIEKHSEELSKLHERLKELNNKRIESELNDISDWLKESIDKTLRGITDYVKNMGGAQIYEYTLQKVNPTIECDYVQDQPLDYQFRTYNFECYNAVELMFKYDREIVKEYIIKWFEDNCPDYSYRKDGSSYFKGF